MIDDKTPKQNSHPEDSHRNAAFYNTKVETAVFIAIPLIILLLARITTTSLFVIGFGALGVISITLAKTYRNKSSFFISILFILCMIMVVIWRWTDIYLIQILSADITENPLLFRVGIIEGILSILLVLLYEKQLNHMRMKISYEWYSSKTYRKFIGLLSFFFIFLTMFWLSGFLIHWFFSGQSYDKHDASIGAAIISFIIAGTPTLFYMLKSSGEQKSRHRHSRRSHR